MRLEYDVGIIDNERKNETHIVQLNRDNCPGDSVVIWNEMMTHKQSGNSWMGLPRFLKRRRISPRLAAVQKLSSKFNIRYSSPKI